MSNDQTITDEEFSDRDIADDEQITFTGLELRYFVLELKDMFFSGNLNIPKAIYSARIGADLYRLMEHNKASQKTDTNLLK